MMIGKKGVLYNMKDVKNEKSGDGHIMLLGLAVLLLGFLIGFFVGANSTKHLAIKNNVAYYTSDTYGNVTFHWNSNTNR
jgi:hypothetical protein